MFSSLKVVLSPPTFQGSLEEMESWEQGGDQGKGGSVKMGRLGGGAVPLPHPSQSSCNRTTGGPRRNPALGNQSRG